MVEFLDQTDKEVNACVDQTRPILALDISVLKQAFLRTKKRGVKLRYITEITRVWNLSTLFLLYLYD